MQKFVFICIKLYMSLYSDIFGVTENNGTSINSKLKGNRNEVVLAKLLSQWTGHEFQRIPQSGGLRWRNSMNICGDVLCTDNTFNFPFSVETKHLKNFELNQSLRKNSIIYRIFKQARDDAKRSNKIPVVFIRKNNMQSKNFIVIFELSIFNEIPVNPLLYGENLIGFDSQDIFRIDFFDFKMFINAIHTGTNSST